jgi:hypothetical protein
MDHEAVKTTGGVVTNQMHKLVLNNVYTIFMENEEDLITFSP